MKYREAYSPDLIDKLSLGKRILDPFSGCGSILIGAAIRDRKSLGIDLNPVAAFSTKVKLSPLNSRQLEHTSRFASVLLETCQTTPRSPLPELSIAHKVFEPRILDTLLRLRTAIEDIGNEDESIRDFLLLGWLSIFEEVGSYFKEGNGIKYRNKKRSIGKYEDRLEGEWQRARFGSNQRQFVLTAFKRKIDLMLSDTVLWRSGSWRAQRVLQDNAFNLDRLCKNHAFDSIIFSPPYANRFDYFEAFKVELWFGSFVKSYLEMAKLRKASLRSHLNADFKRPTSTVEPVEELVDLMDRDASSWRMGVPDLMRGYFSDLRTILMSCRKKLNGGKCYVVVGNSAFAGVVFPTDLLTACVGASVGFRRSQIIEVRHLTVAPQQRNRLRGFEQFMRESIVVLE